MRKVMAWSIVMLLSTAPLAVAQEPASEADKTLYALGLALSQNLAPFALTEQEVRHVAAGLVDGTLGKEHRLDLNAYRPKIQELQRTRMAAAADVEKKKGETFLAEAAKKPGAKKTASGLVITTLTPGTGPAPSATDKVKVHYQGTLIDGTVFDSSVQRGQPATFPLNGVIKCWTEGVQLMKVGGKSRLVCPADLAYGDRGAPPRIKPGSTLVFEVELLEIVK
jgi:FKBP-type peptidyl-prolyl cis-trans isomerase FkpA/FKBP-type peptidyl-prolyl cis-trans isomerase FklB